MVMPDASDKRANIVLHTHDFLRIHNTQFQQGCRTVIPSVDFHELRVLRPRQQDRLSIRKNGRRKSCSTYCSDCFDCGILVNRDGILITHFGNAKRYNTLGDDYAAVGEQCNTDFHRLGYNDSFCGNKILLWRILRESIGLHGPQGPNEQSIHSDEQRNLVCSVHSGRNIHAIPPGSERDYKQFRIDVDFLFWNSELLRDLMVSTDSRERIIPRRNEQFGSRESSGFYSSSSIDRGENIK